MENIWFVFLFSFGTLWVLCTCPSQNTRQLICHIYIHNDVWAICRNVFYPWIVLLSFSTRPFVCGWYVAQTYGNAKLGTQIEVDLEYAFDIKMRNVHFHDTMFNPNVIVYKVLCNSTFFQNSAYFVQRSLSPVSQDSFRCTMFIKEVQMHSATSALLLHSG